ncbi:MAG: phage portal protein [Armatimonadetes bacterium]|nr:phage portal protein [Armatimonadota bacterium]
MDHRTPIPSGYHTLLASYSRWSLAEISRYLWDNVGMVYYATDLLANYSSPVTPRGSTADREWNSAANELFDEWAASADFFGRLDYPSLQRAASFYLDTDGEAFLMWLEDGGTPRVHLLDPWKVFKPSDTKQRIEDGVQLDAENRVVGYWLDQKVFVPASTMTHLVEWDRVVGARGISPIRRGANHMRDGSDILGYQKILSKLSTAIGGVIEGSPLPENPFGTPAIPEGENREAEEAPPDSEEPRRSYTVAELIGGDIPILEEGQAWKQVSTPSSPGNNLEVISFLAGCFVAGMGLPPAFFLDEKLTGPNQRAVNGKAQKRFDKRKTVMQRLARDAWLRVIAAAIADGRLPAVEGWSRCAFVSPARLTIDAGREMAQEREDVAQGLMSRREHFGNRGQIWQREIDQSFEELDYILDRAKALAEEHGLPLAMVAGMFGIKAQTNEPDPSMPAPANPGRADDAD